MMMWSYHFDSCILVTLILYQLLHRPTWECGLDFFHACFTISARTQCGYICECSISIGNVSMAGGWVDEITDSRSLIGRSHHNICSPPIRFNTNLIHMYLIKFLHGNRYDCNLQNNDGMHYVPGLF